MTEPAISAQVAELQRRLANARTAGESQMLEILIQDLETAVEELRVADDEVRAQQQEVARLLEDQELTRWRYERMVAVVPVPVFTTDRAGQMRSMNPAAAALLGIRVDHLLRKPVFTYVAEADRIALRTALADALQRRSTRRQSVKLQLRDSSTQVTAYVAPSPLSPTEATWLVLPSRRPATPAVAEEEHPEDHAGVLPDSLIALFALSGSGLDPREMLQRAAYIAGGTLGPGAEASLVLGSPLDPTEVASTSLDAQVLDRWQLEEGNGPAVLCYDSATSVVTSNLRGDPRWGSVGAEHSSLTSAVVVPLAHADGLHGVLAVYLHGARPPSARLVETVEILAAAITSVLQELGLRDHLESLATDMRAALASRSVIEQAKGIVMAAKHCDAEEAFQHLVMLSNTGHLKLRDVARQIVESASG